MKALFKPKVLVPILAAVLAIGFVLYILLAPPTMWKPIYIRFENTAAEAQGAVPTDAPAEALPVAEQPTEAHGEAIPYRPGEGIMFSLGTKIVNLAEPGGRRYLQIGVVLECLPSEVKFYDLTGAAREEAVKEETAALESLRPVLEDTVISLLTSRTYAEIFTVEGKSLLKQEMLTEMNGVLGYEKVASVYFTEFLVQ